MDDDYKKWNREQGQMAIRVAWSLVLLAISLSLWFLSMTAINIIGMIK
jgi:hypothetical protein